MIVEKINNNKAKIILTFNELKFRKITLSEIQKNKNKAHDFFIKLIEDSNLNESFLTEDSTLFIEASTCNDSFIVIITKVTVTDNYNFNKVTSSYKIDSNIFEFDNLTNLLRVITILPSVKLNDTALYYYNKKYFLIFSNILTKTSKFIKYFIFLSEYCNNIYKTKFTNIIYEYGKCIFAKNALENLYSYTLE